MRCSSRSLEEAGGILCVMTDSKTVEITTYLSSVEYVIM